MLPPRQSFTQRMQSIQQAPMQGAEQNGNAGANGGGGTSNQQMPSQIQQSADQQQQNQDAPMGDPVDTIAQMLGLDLSAAASPDQQGQMVTSAVEALVLQLHQYVDQYGLLDGQQAPDDQLNDGEQQFEDDGGEGAEDGEGQEGIEPAQDGGEPVEEEPPADNQQQQAPPKKKKPSAIAASFFGDDSEPPTINNRVLTSLKRSRELQLSQLVQEGYITPVMYKELKVEFCSNNSIALSLSQDDGAPDEFEKVCSRFIKNGKLLELSSETFGAQDGYRVLKNTKGETEESPLVAAAEERAKEVQRKREIAAGRR